MRTTYIKDLTFCRKCPHGVYKYGTVSCIKSYNPMCIIAAKVVDGYTLYNQKIQRQWHNALTNKTIKRNYRKGRYQMGHMTYIDMFTGERHYKFIPGNVEIPVDCPYRLEMILNAKI